MERPYFKVMERFFLHFFICRKLNIASGKLWKYSVGQKQWSLIRLLLCRKWIDLDEIWSTEHIVGGWPWQIMGTICAVLSRNFLWFLSGQVNNAQFHWFYIEQILRHLKTTTSIGKAVKTFGTELWKFYHKGSFKKRKNCSQHFQSCDFGPS